MRQVSTNSMASLLRVVKAMDKTNWDLWEAAWPNG